MGSTIRFLVLAVLAVPGGASLVVDPPALRLTGPDARAQLIVTKQDASGRLTDLTTGPGVHYESLNPMVATVNETGQVQPTGDGQTRLRIRAGGAGAEDVLVEVNDHAGRRPVQFARDVVPILTRLGCNGGGCHGKASGRNGFRLSLLGSNPAMDWERLVREGRGRRVFPAAPELSLMLRKPTGRVPHGGGTRLKVDSPEYRVLARWIGQGMAFSPHEGPELSGLDVQPARRVVPKRGTQQLRVVARYNDGSEADVTSLAQFQTNAADLVEVDAQGKVIAQDGVGAAAVMARFSGQVAVARLTIPLGASVPEWSPPEARSFVDTLVFANWKELGLRPSPACDDAEFARRSSLDLCGTLPTPAEVTALEADDAPDKRVKWVDRLLDRPEYADRFAMFWAAILRNKRTLGPLSQPGTFAFHAWVRQALAENRPYDQFATAILTAQGDAAINPPVVWFRQVNTVDDQTDDTAQLFLGIRLQCARCHHHPTERWSQDDYADFSEFFRRIGRKPGSDPATPRIFVRPSDPSIQPPRAPRLLGAPEPLNLPPDRDPRAALADWLTQPENPYFARAVVNRYWKHFFGRGLVEPEDDMRASNPPSNPELLDALASDFIAHGYDLKRLARTLATSRAYERSSWPNAGNRDDRRAFSRFAPRRLAAEVLLDAIDEVAGVREVFDALPRGFRATQLPDEGFDTPGRFLDVFGRPRRLSVCECERSNEANLSQSLLLLNAPEIEHKLTSPDGRAARLADDPRPELEKVIELYRVALARPPTPEERDVCLTHLARRRAQGHARQAYEDLIWTLINIKEFQFVP